MVVLIRWYRWESLSFIPDYFFFYLSHSLVVFFLSVEAVRELKTVGKRQGYLYTQTLFRNLRLICDVKLFHELVEIVTFRKTRRGSIEFSFGHDKFCRMFGGYV